MKFKTDQNEFFKLLEDTWPPEKVIHFDNWTIRISDGAGKRASAISLEGVWEENSFRKLKDLLKKLDKPVLVEMWKERFFYFVLKWEFNYIDNLGKGYGFLLICSKSAI